jgi:hypothetical protein
MKAFDSRIRRLQARLCPDAGQEQRLWVANIFGRELALDQDRCIKILGECGFLPKTRFGVLSFCGILDGLNAKELEQYLRRNGAETCGFDAHQKHVSRGDAIPPEETGLLNQAQMSAGVLR